MATVERGKGKRRHVIRIVRDGAILRRRENEGGDERLPGFMRCAGEAAAADALASEVLACLADGMQPADDEARAIAATAAAAKAAPALPLRCDLGIYNEATGFVVTSRRMAGKAMDEGSPEWLEAVRRGDMLPFQLIQDDSFVIRIVAGEPLSAQESEEWVARTDWHLDVPDGRLCVTGGAPFSNEDYDAGDAWWAQFVGEVAIPKGRYRASLYTHLHGVNGSAVIDHLAGGYDRGEPLDAWMSRTQSDATVPEWDETLEPVAFLLHLEPVAAAPKDGLTALPDGGWFDSEANARKPERCPLGVVASNVQRRSGAASGEWTYVREVFPPLAARCGGEPPAIADGAPVTLAATAAAHAARIAWFAAQVVFELRLALPAGASADFGGPWPEGVVGVPEGGVERLLFSSDLDPSASLARIAELEPRLAAMPDGTTLELCAAPMDPSPEGAGWLWLRGPLRAGDWHIERAFPAAASAALTGALSLAREVDGTSIAVRDRAEGEAILGRAKRTLGRLLDRNPPRLGKTSIAFRKPGEEVGLLGIAVFASRFGSTWPVLEASAPPEEEEDEDDDGMFPTSPIQGALIHAAPGGRAWHQTMALLLSEKIADRIRTEEKALKSAGFREIGDLMTPAQPEVAYHGYARKDGTAFAWFRVSYPDQVTLALCTPLVDGQAMVTPSDAAPTTSELVAEHDRRAAAHAAAPMPGSMQAFAEVLERAAGTS